MTTTHKMTPAKIAQLRLKAWKAVRAAGAALTEYACAAESHEEPCMSNDAIDAADLAEEVRRYDYRHGAGLNDDTAK